jgi:hypothetical protein
MYLGGGGGACGENSSSGRGGNGGAIIGIDFGGWLRVNGRIWSNGENGVAAARGGSGGAGGTIRLRGRLGTLGNGLRATGGVKGAGGGANRDGSNGRIHLDICQIFDLTTYSSTPTADITSGGHTWCAAPSQII